MTEERATPAPDALAEAWFRALFEHSAAGMAVMDPDGRYHMVNAALAELLGRSADELRGLAMTDVTHPDDLGLSRDAARQVRAGEPSAVDKRYLRADGRVVWARVTCTRWIGPDDHTWVLVVVQDITARKEAEASLAAREAELAMTFDDAPFGMALNDPVDGRFLRANRALLELVGYSRSELLQLHWIDLVHPSERADSVANLDRQREGDAWERDVVRRIVKKDGQTAWLRCKGQVVRDPVTDAPRYCVGQFVDLTPIRQHEEERRLLEEHLRHSQRSETVGRLAGGLVHDFNNMLAVILNVAEITRMRAPDARTRSYVDQIHSAATRAAVLSRRLMTINRRDEPAIEVLEVNVMIEEIRHLIQRAVGEDVYLVVELESPLPGVRLVRPQLEQALLNLAVNARDAMPLGGKLTLRTSTHTSTGGDFPAGDYVRIDVGDTGTGMPDDVAAHAFDAFFTTKEAGRGTGLGLAIVQHAVTTAGGHLRVHTVVGEGTTFAVYLPAVAPEPAVPGTPAQVAARGHGERVLVVEDELTLLDLAVQLLADHGYVPLAAPGGEPAMELVRHMKGRIDLVLTDLVMPGASGTQLATLVRETHPEANVLFMSGHADDRVLQHAPAGITVLRKPFTAAELLAAVRVALDGQS